MKKISLKWMERFGEYDLIFTFVDSKIDVANETYTYVTSDAYIAKGIISQAQHNRAGKAFNVAKTLLRLKEVPTTTKQLLEALQGFIDAHEKHYVNGEEYTDMDELAMCQSIQDAKDLIEGVK
jgi:hypothetical protein